MLECWNSGKMGFGILGEWITCKIHFGREIEKWIESLKYQYSIIPLFHPLGYI
jgi:hypothetical protein